MNKKQLQTRNWNISFYKYNKNNIRNSIYLTKWVEKLITIYFYKYFISKPIFKYYNNKLVILIYLYTNKKGLHLKKSNLNKLIKYLEKILMTKLELKIIKLQFPYLNADILSKYLAIQSKRRNYQRLQLKLFNKIKKARFNILNYLMKKTKQINYISDINNYKPILRRINPINYLNKLNYSHLVGLQLQLKGRFSRRRTGERSKKRFSSKGSLQNINSSLFNERVIPIRNYQKANIDYSKFTTKNKNGAFTLKVWLSGK